MVFTSIFSKSVRVCILSVSIIKHEDEKITKFMRFFFVYVFLCLFKFIALCLVFVVVYWSFTQHMHSLIMFFFVFLLLDIIRQLMNVAKTESTGRLMYCVCTFCSLCNKNIHEKQTNNIFQNQNIKLLIRHILLLMMLIYHKNPMGCFSFT